MNRKILYGYQIQDGIILLQHREAEVVKRIFSLCLGGKFQWEIAEILNTDGIIYSQGRPKWTKTRTAFILKNPRYMGADDYPIIIDRETFQEVQNMLQKRRGVLNRMDRPVLRYRSRLRCERCGGPLKRRFSGRDRKDTLYLQCESCVSRVTIDDASLLSEIERQLAAHTPPEQSAIPYEPSGDVVRLTNAINRGLEKPDQPEEIVKLILQGVSARYACFSQELDPIDIHGEEAIQYITISADNAVTVTFKG